MHHRFDSEDSVFTKPLQSRGKGMSLDRLSYRLFGLITIINMVFVIVPLTIAPLPPLAPGADLVAFNRDNSEAIMLSNYIGALEWPLNTLLIIFVAAATRVAEH